MDQACRTLDDIVARIIRTVSDDKSISSEEDGTEYFFRGEQCNYSDPSSPILDTAFDSCLDRSQAYWGHEREIYQEAMRLNVASFSEDRTMTERVARMQHYMLPTRFADLSTNALLATLFAVGGCAKDAKTHEREDGFVRIIKIARHKMKSFTSDIITAILH